MSSVAATVSKDKMKVLETVLSSPGMAEKCRISLQVSRQSILLLGRLIEAGLSSETRDDLLAVLPKETAEELQAVQEELLKKGALTDFYQRLKSL
jgi:hypothetical protein